MKNVKISNKVIGAGKPCFIIAEAGINHNGKFRIAKKMVDAAKKAGSDAVKFQIFRAERLVTATAKKASYQEESTGKGSQYEMLKKLELTEDEFKNLAAHARKKNIIFLASAFDDESVDFLDGLKVPAFKVPSGEITNFPLLEHIARKRKPIILSTGMSTLKEVAEALSVLGVGGAREIVLLHSVSDYPARLEDVNLRAIDTLKREFNLPVGFSDHTLGITVPIAAVSLGAAMIEKHFTLDKKLAGPDHKASL
jgi:sialic acid synthase SpsE